jgi:hypothetical protein
MGCATQSSSPAGLRPGRSAAFSTRSRWPDLPASAGRPLVRSVRSVKVSRPTSLLGDGSEVVVPRAVAFREVGDVIGPGKSSSFGVVAAPAGRDEVVEAVVAAVAPGNEVVNLSFGRDSGAAGAGSAIRRASLRRDRRATASLASPHCLGQGAGSRGVLVAELEDRRDDHCLPACLALAGHDGGRGIGERLRPVQLDHPLSKHPNRDLFLVEVFLDAVDQREQKRGLVGRCPGGLVEEQQQLLPGVMVSSSLRGSNGPAPVHRDVADVPSDKVEVRAREVLRGPRADRLDAAQHVGGGSYRTSRS